MKLTKGKLLETIRLKNEGATTWQARKVARISIRRVNQVWQEYLASGVLPERGKQVGRPSIPVRPEDVDVVGRAYRLYRVSAATLERLIERDFHLHIPHNRIHTILVQLGFAQKHARKDVRKKAWIRYERRHSLTAVHIDWHYYGGGVWVFAVIDDASRKLLALIECDSPTTDASIRGMRLALAHGRIKQCISDHGSQFTCNVIDGNSQFQAFLRANGIRPILCRIKHPQSNGKVEKWFETYDKHRFAFQTAEAFVQWYNELRPHRSLNFAILETPQMAFERKLKVEV
jgi:transposase InsO family protein